MHQKERVTGQEKTFPEHYTLISFTDARGIITFANAELASVCGYSCEEMVGQPHNILRHPDMPRALFEDLWRALKNGRPWKGLIKNRCRDGDHYWVDAYVTPIVDDGRIVEYQSVRTAPTRQQIQRADRVYSKWRRERLPQGLQRESFPLALKLDLLLAFPFLGLYFAVPPLAMDHLGAWLSGAYLLSATAVTLALSPFDRLCAETRQINNNPVMQWIYTGSTGCSGTIEYGLATRQTQLRALSATGSRETTGNGHRRRRP